MSTPTIVMFHDDFPCDDWKGTPQEVQDCQMKKDWCEGECRMCGQCGHEICYNENQEEPFKPYK